MQAHLYIMPRLDLHLYRLANWQPFDMLPDTSRVKGLPGSCACFLEMFPTLIVDGNHALRFECMENLHGLPGIQRKSQGPHAGESCRPDVQYGCPDPEALADLA